MAVYTEPSRPLEFLMSEANGQLSRETVTIVAGAGALTAGRVLGMITASGKFQAYDDANTPAGVGTALAILAYDVPASASDQTVTVIRRDAEVKGALLGWGSQTAPQIASGIVDLAAVGIIVRN